VLTHELLEQEVCSGHPVDARHGQSDGPPSQLVYCDQ
jgi:hypothetical protein